MDNPKRSLRLGFAGTPEFALPALDALAGSRHTLAAVFTQPDRPAGRGRGLHSSIIKQRAAALGLAVYQPASLKTAEAQASLRSLELDALVVVAYGLILPAAALALPRYGCFNIHASLLPRWRGAAPIQRAVLAGDTMTGVTIMHMDAGLDTGPMLAVGETPIGDRDTAGDLHDRLAALGGRLLLEVLDRVADAGVSGTAQPSTGVTYAEKISKAEAQIDWHGAAVDIGRRVRAFNPWPVAETRWEGQQLRVWEAQCLAGAATAAAPGSVLAASGAGIDVACGSGVLRLQRLQLAGRKPLAVAEFIKAQAVAGAQFSTP